MSRRYIRDPNRFKVSENNVLTKVTGNYANIAIPNTVEYILDQLFYENNNLESVIMPNSVLKIYDMAFYRCVNLEHVVLSNRLTYIGGRSFCGCEKLEHITFFEGLKEIGSAAFWGCQKLAEISLPEGLEWIGDDAFGECSLSSVRIPSSVKSVGTNAFACDSFVNFEVDENNPWLKSINGILYSKDGKTLIRYAMGKNEETFVIPNTVTRIGVDAFRWCNLTNIILPNTITDIYTGAFSGCKKLQRLEIPSSVSNIGKYIISGSDSVELVVDPQNKYYKVKNGELFTTKWGGLTKVI